MGFDIFADKTVDLQFMPGDDSKPAHFIGVFEGGLGPTFRIKTLSYWEVQEILAETTDVGKTRKGIELGLVSINDKPDWAKQFIANPRLRMVNPLFDAIWSQALGN